MAVGDVPGGGRGRGELTSSDRLPLLVLTLELSGVGCHRHLAGAVTAGGLVGDEHGVSVADSVIIEAAQCPSCSICATLAAVTRSRV